MTDSDNVRRAYHICVSSDASRGTKEDTLLTARNYFEERLAKLGVPADFGVEIELDDGLWIAKPVPPKQHAIMLSGREGEQAARAAGEAYLVRWFRERGHDGQIEFSSRQNGELIETKGVAIYDR